MTTVSRTTRRRRPRLRSWVGMGFGSVSRQRSWVSPYLLLLIPASSSSPGSRHACASSIRYRIEHDNSHERSPSSPPPWVRPSSSVRPPPYDIEEDAQHYRRPSSAHRSCRRGSRSAESTFAITYVAITASSPGLEETQVQVQQEEVRPRSV